MAANPMQVFDRLGFAKKITMAGWTIHRLTLEDYNGDIIQVSDLSAVSKLFGFETVALHRSLLQRVLSEQLPSGVLNFGAEAKSLIQGTDSVSVLLADGFEINARIVVGADGMRSRIRQLAVSQAARYATPVRRRTALSLEDHVRYPRSSITTLMEIWGRGAGWVFRRSLLMTITGT